MLFTFVLFHFITLLCIYLTSEPSDEKIMKTYTKLFKILKEELATNNKLNPKEKETYHKILDGKNKCLTVEEIDSFYKDIFVRISENMKQAKEKSLRFYRTDYPEMKKLLKSGDLKAIFCRRNNKPRKDGKKQ